MKINLSIMGEKTTVRNYEIAFENPAHPMAVVWGQVRSVWEDLFEQLAGGDKSVIFHNMAGLQKKYAHVPTSHFFSVDNALEFTNGMIHLAMYGINAKVVEAALYQILNSHEIKAGVRINTPEIYPTPSPFHEYDMAPFGVDLCVSAKKRMTDDDRHYFQKRMGELSKPSSKYKIGRYMCSFREEVQRVQEFMHKGLYAVEVNRTMLPVPFINYYFLIAVLRTAHVSATPDNIEELGTYASMLLNIYAANAESYQLKMTMKDEEDFWSALDSFAILPPINKTETLVTTYQSMLDACKPFLYTKSSYETYINEMSDEDFRRMFVNMKN